MNNQIFVFEKLYWESNNKLDCIRIKDFHYQGTLKKTKKKKKTISKGAIYAGT